MKISLVVAGLLIATLLYKLVDNGVTLTYTTDSLQRRNKQVEVLLPVAQLQKGKSTKLDIENLAKSKGWDSFVKKTTDEWWVEGVGFTFNGNLLKEIKTEPSAPQLDDARRRSRQGGDQ